MTEEVAYRTEVITSRDGTEQRIAQRVNPRYIFRSDARVGPARAAELERLLVKRQASNYRFQHPRASVLAARGHPGAGGFIGRFEREPSVAARTDRVLDVQIAVQINPGVYPGDYLTNYVYPDPVTFHNGLEVLTLQPNWAEAVRLNFSQFREILDLQRGVTGFNTPERFTTRLVECGFMLRNAAEEDALRGLFARMRGQQGEFYMADPLTSQIKVVGPVSSGSSFFTVPGVSFHQRFQGEQIYRNLAIKTQSGYIYRRVASVSIVDGNSRVAFDATLPAIEQVLSVQWLLKMRFAADTLVIGWITDTTGRVNLNFRALEDV